VVSFTSRPFQPWKNPGTRSECVPEPVRTFSNREKSVVIIGIWTQDRPARSRVAIPTAIFRLPKSTAKDKRKIEKGSVSLLVSGWYVQLLLNALSSMLLVFALRHLTVLAARARSVTVSATRAMRQTAPPSFRMLYDDHLTSWTNRKCFNVTYIIECNEKRKVGRDSSVGTATCHWLDDPGFEFRWGARFSAPVQTGSGANLASYTMGTGSFPGGKSAGTWRWPPTPI